MKLFELFATLELQADKFNDGINKAQGAAQNFAGKVQSAVSAGTVALGNLMARGVEVAANAVKNIGGRALNVTGQLEQVMGGSEAVFDVWAENIQAKSSKAFKMMGLSAADYLETANKMGSLFQGSGFTTVESFEMTADAMQRAADVASVMGIDTAWAMESIAGLAKSNFTMMDNLGVSINETALANYALEKGIKKSTAAMSTQEKVGLALELFMEKTEKYAGNRLRENDTIVGAIETANAAWKNLLSGAENFTEDDFIYAIENAFNVISRNTAKIRPRLINSFLGIAERAIPKIKAAFVDFWNNDLPDIATSGANLVITAVNEFFGLNIPKIQKIDLPTAEEIATALSTLWNNVTEKTSGLFQWTLGLFTPPDESIDHLGSLSTWWYGTALPFITDTFNWTIGIFQPPEEGVDPNGYIAQWWDNTVLPFLHETCTWTLNMFLPPDENGDITPESVITGWWENVAGSVVAACQWVLGLFSGVADTNEEGDDPKTIIEFWWGNIVDEIIKACEWALGIFQQPVETIDDVKGIVEQWWSGVVNGAVAACEWVLGLFQEPTATEGDAATTVYGWWKDVVVGVVSACKWFLGLFSGVSSDSDADGNIITPFKIVTGWWNNTIDTVVGVCKWLLGHFSDVSDDTDANGEARSVSDIVSAWWNDTAGAVVKACSWVLGIFTDVSDDTDAEGKPNTAADVVGAWWDNVKASVVAACQWTIGLFSGVSNGTDADGNETTPESIVSTWWGTVVDSIVAACNWTIGLFTGVAEKDAEGNEAHDIVSKWWGTVVGEVQNACAFVAHLAGFTATDENGKPVSVEDSATKWWTEKAVPALKGIFKWTVGIEWGEWDESAESDAKTWWGTIKSNIARIAGNLGGIGSTLIDALFGTAEDITSSTTLPGTLASISEFFADFTTGANEIIELAGSLQGAFTTIATGIIIAAAAMGNFLPAIIATVALIGDAVDTNEKLKNQSFGDFTGGKYTDEDLKTLQQYVDLQKQLAEINAEISEKGSADIGVIKEYELLGSAIGKVENALGQIGEGGIIEEYQAWVRQRIRGNADAWSPSGLGGLGLYTNPYQVDVIEPPETDILTNVSEESENNMQKQLNDMDLSAPVKMLPDMSQIPKSVTVDAVSGVSPSLGGHTGALKPEQIVHKNAVGLNYVPYNDFPSLLHEGEAVLTKAEATAWRRNETTGNVSIDYDRLGSIVAAAVAEAVSVLAIQMDKQTVGSIVSPVVFREMGRQLGSKRFAT